MTTMSVDDARTHFSELLDQVVKGKTILITRRGKPAAVLGPPPATAEKDVKQVVKEMLEYRDRQKRTMGSIRVRKIIEEGRRY